MNPMENELIMPGIRFGSVTSKNARNGPAPSVAACSSNLSPSAAVTSVIMVMQYGTEATVCISMIPAMLSPRPTFSSIIWAPIASTVPGTSSGKRLKNLISPLPRNSYSSVARTVAMPIVVLMAATAKESDMLLSSSLGSLAEPKISSFTVRSDRLSGSIPGQGHRAAKHHMSSTMAGSIMHAAVSHSTGFKSLPLFMLRLPAAL